MNQMLFSIGDPVEMTAEAIEMDLQHQGRKRGVTTGRVVMYNPQAGVVTVLRDGDRMNRIYLEKFWRKKVETTSEGA